MSTCGRCGISAWHPEARTCTAPDCELRRPVEHSTPAVLTTGRPRRVVTIDHDSAPGSWADAIALGCLGGGHQVAGDGQPERLGRGVHVGQIHALAYRPARFATS